MSIEWMNEKKIEESIFFSNMLLDSKGMNSSVFSFHSSCKFWHDSGSKRKAMS